MEQIKQTKRNKTKYNSPCSSATWSAKQTTDARIPLDACWKYSQRNSQDTVDKSTRRHQSSMAEPAMSYYSPANTYKSMKHHSYPCTTHTKHPSILHTDASHRYQSTNTKCNKNQDYANNVGVVINKDHYKNQQEDETDARYIDEELENFTEDNLEDDVEEEAGNDQERIGGPLNKEYDEQEADDEIDEESDAPAEPQAVQRDALKKDALLRAQQRLRTIDQQPDSHRVRYQHQHSPRPYQAHTMATRYCDIPDHDIHEALSEEDLYVTQTLKSPPRRSSAGYHQNWIPPRSSVDRYDTTTTPNQSSRRARTKPLSKSFMEAEFVDRRKCSRCGNVSIRKPSSSRKNNCRFQDTADFSNKGHYGDDVEVLDQSWCGRCKPKHYFEENAGPNEIPPPALYSMKARRSRDASIPMYETLEGKRVTDELSHEYSRIPLRYAKDASNVLRDRMRQQAAQGSTRTSVRYDP